MCKLSHCRPPLAVAHHCKVFTVHRSYDIDSMASNLTGGSQASSASGGKSQAGRKGAPIFEKDVAFDGLGTFTNSRQNRRCRFCKCSFKALTKDVACKHILHECKADPGPDQAARDAAHATLAAGEEAAGSASLPPLPDGRKKRKTTLDDFVDSKAVPKDLKKTYDTALFRFLVMAGLSFAAVDSPYFLQFVELLRPNYKPAGELLHRLT
jgi:hypothetical protein